MAEEDDLYVGRRALEEGLVRKEQLFECLLDLAQERKAREGQMAPRPLGAILVTRGFLRQADLNRVLTQRLAPPTPRVPAAAEDPVLRKLLLTAQHAERWTDEQLAADLDFGKVVIACQYATREQVDECARLQRAAKEAGLPARRLGEILIEKGYLTAPQLQRALAYREKAIYFCTGCGARFNVLHARPEAKYVCKKCGRRLEPAGAHVAQADSSIYDLKIVPPEAPPTPPPAPPAIPAPDQAEIDRAVALYVRQRNMIRRDALREAVQFQDEVARYGVEVPLLEVFNRRKVLSWQQIEQVRKVDFAATVRAESWRSQAVPGYRITGKVAAGGFATIFAAEPVFGDRRLALKVLRAERARDPVAVDRFRREGALMMKLDHPHIVKAFDLAEVKGLPYIAMELVEGGPLDARVRGSGPLPPDRALRVARQVAEALAYMQKEGYIHRDMKPENILLDGTFDAKVCDLGFAAPIRERAVGASAVTLGTAGYVSPEQARGELDLKVGTDIYSLGLTLYFALTAYQPFEGSDSETLMSERFAAGVAAPDFERLRAPAPLVEIVKKMLHPERSQRFTTYPELLAAFGQIRV